VRVIKACFVMVSAVFSALVILWVGSQTPPDHGSWSFVIFWRALPIALVASVLMLGAGVRTAITSKTWSILLSVGMLLGLCTTIRFWDWLLLAMVLLVAFVTYASAAYRIVWWLAVAASILLSAWWLGVALYAFYDFLSPEQSSAGAGSGSRGGPSAF